MHAAIERGLSWVRSTIHRGPRQEWSAHQHDTDPLCVFIFPSVNIRLASRSVSGAGCWHPRDYCADGRLALDLPQRSIRD
jgi:hypothetical protein